VRALTGPARAWLTQRPPARLAAAWTFAVAGPAVVTAALLPFRSSLSLGGFFFCMLAAVLAGAALGGSRPALTTVALGAAAGATFYDHRALSVGTDLVSLIAFAAIGAALGILVGELAQLAGEQASSQQVEAALRRVDGPACPDGQLHRRVRCHGRGRPRSGHAFRRRDADHRPGSAVGRDGLACESAMTATAGPIPPEVPAWSG
jgi:two-component system sensor histidine kinase KdpD